ncbi:MAG: NAD-binding protein [Armatimonadetes bacterium]|nr:NAD-binding protein [Armatimonadota bacterium]
MAKVGFVGLGVMGGPMAGHLLKAGHQLTVWNRTPGKADELAAQGATEAKSLQELAENCEIIFSCVGRSEDVAEVVRAMAPHAKPGTTFVDHSTIEPSMAKTLHEELKLKNLNFVDAPITGGSMGAKNGTLTIFCGGDHDVVAHAMTIMLPYTKRAERVGEAGQGQVMKLANQIAVGGALIGLCECLAFAEKAGLDIQQAHSMIGSGAGGSWAFENYGRMILNRDWTPGFSVKNQRKDFGYCEAAAGQMNADIPLTELVNRLLGVLQSQGREEDTTAALFEVYTQS